MYRQSRLRAAKDKGNTMNKRLFFPVSIFTLLAIGTITSAIAASGVDSQDRGHGPSRHELVIQPGTDPSTVQLHFVGAQRVTFSGVGSLQIIKADGGIWKYKPQVYQMVNGKRRDVPVTFSTVGRDRVALRVHKFDSSEPLMVTPVAGVTDVQ
jgi:hypothetical protein